MTTFPRVDPTMIVHTLAAMLAWSCPRNARMPIEPHYCALNTHIHTPISIRYFHSNAVIGMIPGLPPLRGFYYNRLFDKSHHHSPFSVISLSLSA